MQSDFVTDPGQFSVRGGIVDVFSFANEYPYRIEFNEDELESIRTFDINTQLSIENHKNVVIIPNTEAKKTNSNKTSFINYLPSNSQLWIKDISFVCGKIDDLFQKSQNESQRNNKNIKLDFKDLFCSGSDFINEIKTYKIIELERPILNPLKTISLNISPLTIFNKNIDLVIVDLYNNTITRFNANNEEIKLINSKEDVDKLVYDCGVSSYPRFCVHRNGTCVESISGNYENIKTILNYYL